MHHRILAGVLALLFALLPCSTSPAQKSDKKAKDSLEERFKELQADLAKGQQKILARLPNANDEQERNAIVGEYFDINKEYSGKFLALAKTDPDDEEATAPLLYLVLNSSTSDEADEAADLLVKHHLDSKRVQMSLDTLGRSRAFGAEKILVAAREKLEDKDLLARATFALGKHLAERAETAQQFQSFDGPRLAAMKKRISKTFADRILKADAAKLTKSAEALFEEFLDKYAKVEPSGPILAEFAKSALFASRNLAIGKEVPEIEGEDIAGDKFSLSDYRGKVILLEFWGHWCDPCRAMYAHHRELAKRLGDKPFVLVGVNSDKDRKLLKSTIKEEQIPGRSFWNGGKTTGSIAGKWNISTWPTLFLIDHKGIIRRKFLGNPGNKVLDEAIDALVAEVVKSKE